MSQQVLMTGMEMDALDVVQSLKRWCIIEGDCVEWMRGFPDQCIDHTITDPPYSEGLYLRYRTNAKRRGAKGYASDDKSEKSAAAMRELGNLRIGAVEDLVPICGPEFRRITKRWQIAFSDAESDHLWRRWFGADYLRSAVWVKTNPAPQISGDRPAQGFEMATIAHGPARKRWNGGGAAGTWQHSVSQGADRPDHPCPKPLELMLELVEQFTDPGDLVLDPFAGSGTTGAACVRLGRRFIGIERDPEFAKLARARLEAEERGLSLRDAAAGQTSIFDVLAAK